MFFCYYIPPTHPHPLSNTVSASIDVRIWHNIFSWDCIQFDRHPHQNRTISHQYHIRFIFTNIRPASLSRCNFEEMTQSVLVEKGLNQITKQEIHPLMFRSGQAKSNQHQGWTFTSKFKTSNAEDWKMEQRVKLLWKWIKEAHKNSTQGAVIFVAKKRYNERSLKAENKLSSHSRSAEQQVLR